MTAVPSQRQFLHLSPRPASVLAGGLLLLLLLVAPAARAASAAGAWPQVALAKDGTPIAYEVHGSGEPTLVFVHGWSCDARYWRQQMAQFARKYRVVALDLAGHGHSGMTRGRYTMRAFGEDVQAVVEAAGSGPVILIGHSMGGAVIAEAARLMPERVIGLIGVDTLENVEFPLSRAEADRMIAPLVDDFRNESRAFVAGMLRPASDPALREWILADMSSAPPFVALSAMEEMLGQYVSGEAARIFTQIRVPVVCVNGDLWPINSEGNRRHMRFFEAIVLPGADHFLMLTRPYEFNNALATAIHTILRQAGREDR